MSKISIIVPVYKVESYLEKCVKSILNQTIQDIEIILVDDGSPDRCGMICDALSETDRRIHVIHQKNQGLSFARNVGIEASTGKYICFVDSDDLILPNYCQVLLNLLDGTSFDFSFCGVHRFRDGIIPTPENIAGNTTTVSNADFLKMQLEKQTEFGVWNKLFRREIFDCIRFAPKRLNEDVIFSADILKNLNHGAIGTTMQLYLYRQREGSIVSNQAMRGSPDRIFAGAYLLDAVTQYAPDLTEAALRYSVDYPWMFVDPIYIRGKFHENRFYLQTLQNFLRDNIQQYEQRNIFSQIQTKRMKLFSASKALYAFNAYARLARVYLFRLIGKDAYQDGHGI
ncbi:MAG: glycosyltransferase family 2 protein [Candidatus Faecousia sp.]|nr:glycosyltransferase family 2 protein [Candidatus Faecousia sp.]